MIRTLFAALLFSCATLANAQSASAKATPHTHETQADAQATIKAKVSMLTDELALNTKQAGALEKMLMAAEDKATALRAKNDHAGLEDLSVSTFTRVRATLTADQATKLDALKAAGKWDVCAAGAGKGCCAGHGAAASGKAGCCAGKGAKAEAKLEHKE